MLPLELDERKILEMRIESLRETYRQVCGREVSDRFWEYLDSIPSTREKMELVKFYIDQIMEIYYRDKYLEARLG